MLKTLKIFAVQYFLLVRLPHIESKIVKIAMPSPPPDVSSFFKLEFYYYFDVHR
jgi:hypothetical protein